MRRLDPEEVRITYFRADSTAPDLGPIELSRDGGVTWATLPAGEDRDGQPAYLFTVAGPDVADADLHGAVRLPRGRTFLITRIVDNPEIHPSRSHIDV